MDSTTLYKKINCAITDGEYVLQNVHQSHNTHHSFKMDIVNM